jgi:hypothetical protein
LTPEETIKLLRDRIRRKDITIEKLQKDRTTITKRGEFEEVISKVGEETVFKRIHYSKRNPAKVTLARIGRIEIFCYPYSSFKKIFIGFGNKAVELTKYDLPKLLGAYNQGRWFIENGKKVVNEKIDSKSELAQNIRLAYIYSSELVMVENKISATAEKIEKFEYMKGMKPDKREKWLEDEGEEFRKEYQEWENQS